MGNTSSENIQGYMTSTKKILVTGGLGYIGSHSVCQLVENGYQPIIIDNLCNSEKSVLKDIEQTCGVAVPFYDFDLRDGSATSNFFKSHDDLEGVIHFAALKAVEESVEHPELYFDNNINSLKNIISEIQQLKQSVALIFSSSATVYGDPDYLPLDEKHPIKKATSPYGETKQLGEKIIKSFIKESNKDKALSLRYFNPIGKDFQGFLKENPKGKPQNLMPIITEIHEGKREQLAVYGNDYETPDGSCIRDYIHVVDVAQAHVLALKFLFSQDIYYDVVNIGTSKGTSVFEMIEWYNKITNRQIPFDVVARRPGDCASVFASNEKAIKLLNWKAQYSVQDALLGMFKN